MLYCVEASQLTHPLLKNPELVCIQVLFVEPFLEFSVYLWLEFTSNHCCTMLFAVRMSNCRQTL